MNKVIEVDFFFHDTNAGLSSSNSFGSWGMKEKWRILIVDDEPGTTRLVKILLEKTGEYFVLEENDLAKAHQSARTFRPHLILLDVVMPQINGSEVAARIQADHELQNTPIIFLTALATRGEAKNSLNIQGRPFLAKPINIPKLINTIKEHLAARAAS
jgi:CheY-like chemotaxis protein